MQGLDARQTESAPPGAYLGQRDKLFQLSRHVRVFRKQSAMYSTYYHIPTKESNLTRMINERITKIILG